ncbi:hypothetical protein L210DRAFT_962264 [Boletus edulis BED1]|uniref:Helicase C-terminal domain-containing protein n=1 Tax=Boletus edulis BED1 TaxID=1328754 RepID=A0AAD4GA57_BOLED|nr:hypothetical protein L210DRAFT_962264 [Boletus edulis BED1]
MVIPKTLVFHDLKQEATDAAAFIESRLPQYLRNIGIVKHYHSDLSGLDIRGVVNVIQYGVCKNMAEAAQRAGRAARDPNSSGLFLMMVEPWALKLSLESISITDPDQPFVLTVKKNSSKQERTSMASTQYVQSQDCLRQFFAIYLGDESQRGKYFYSLWHKV